MQPFQSLSQKQGIQYSEQSYGGILEVFKLGELTPGIVYSYYPNHYEILNLKDEVKKAYEYHGNNNYKFADDYIGNFMIVYSLDEQRILETNERETPSASALGWSEYYTYVYGIIYMYE